MGELGETIDGYLQTTTGANRDAWKRRAREFVTNPDRRDRMRQKLINLLRTMAIRNRANEGERGDTRLKKVVVDNQSGLETYSYAVSGRRNQVKFAISTLPQEAEILELRENLMSSCSGLELARNLRADDDFHHFIATPMGVKWLNIDNRPLLGLWRNGTEVSSFVNKNPGVGTNEQESGGIRIHEGKLSVLPYSDLVASPDVGLVEQATFVADSTNWRGICEIPAYSSVVDFNPLFVGNLYDSEGRETMFSAIYEGPRNGMHSLFEGLNDLSARGNHASWEVACLDMGGVFAGMAKDEDRIIGPSSPGMVTPSRASIDPGNIRDRYLDFQWPRT